MTQMDRSARYTRWLGEVYSASHGVRRKKQAVGRRLIRRSVGITAPVKGNDKREEDRSDQSGLYLYSLAKEN